MVYLVPSVSREGEDVHARMCPCGTAIETRTRKVGYCEIYGEGAECVRGGDEMVKLDVCDMEQFGR